MKAHHGCVTPCSSDSCDGECCLVSIYFNRSTLFTIAHGQWPSLEHRYVDIVIAESNQSEHLVEKQLKKPKSRCNPIISDPNNPIITDLTNQINRTHNNPIFSGSNNLIITDPDNRIIKALNNRIFRARNNRIVRILEYRFLGPEKIGF